MSETARIREEARRISGVRRQVVEAFPQVESPWAPLPATVVTLAKDYRSLAMRAAADVQRRLTGLQGLFGEDVARPLFDAVEELREAFWTALEMEDVRHATRDQEDAHLRRDMGEQRAETVAQLAHAEGLLGKAVADYDARQSRISPARRKAEPAWVTAARLLEAPF